MWSGERMEIMGGGMVKDGVIMGGGGRGEKGFRVKGRGRIESKSY